MTKSILISGWRGLPHSYAMVNQYQCLELLRREDVRLYFEDRPFADPGWKRATGLFSPEDEAALTSIPFLPAGVEPDAEFRISFPYDLVSPPRSVRTIVFGTSEYRMVPAAHIAGTTPLEIAARLHGGSIDVVTPSDWSREGFIRSGLDASRVSVVPHGVDTTLFHPRSPEQRASAREKYKFADGEFVYLHIGAMSGNKNVEMLLGAFAAILRKNPTAKLLMKGMDALYRSKAMFMTTALQSLSSEDAQLALPRVVYIGGSLASDEMRELYHAGDCYVSPYTAEGFNLPVLEAAACGLPIICTADGPTDEFTTEHFAMRIRSEKVASEFEGNVATSLKPDADHLQNLMSGIVSEVEFRQRAAIEGPSFVASRFTWKHAVDKLLAVFFPVQ